MTEGADAPLLRFDSVRLSQADLRRARDGAPEEAADATILRDVSFTLAAGEARLLLGPSGGGKSSLLRLIDRLVEPGGGRIELQGRPVGDWGPAELRRTAVLVGQAPVRFGGTVRDELRRPLEWAGRTVDDAALRAALERVGLAELDLDRDGEATSGGQRTRLGVARALLLEPPLLLLDEPTASLDVRSARRLLEALRGWRAEHRTAVLAVSHRPEDALHLDAPAWILIDGTLHGPYPPEQVAARELPGGPAADFLGRVERVEEASSHGSDGEEEAA